jgi:Ser/Thr protein kinase RdoA (MazF antagonist)
MSKITPPTVLWDRLAWHPAVAAWRQLAHGAPDPEHIEVLEQTKKSAAYRLVGMGPGGESIIAKRSEMSKALIERTVYEQVLPSLPVTSPRYYGCREASPQCAWLFLEDVGDLYYCHTNAEHLAIAGRWVGGMHVAATRVAAARGLPPSGLPRYREHLHAARRTIREHLNRPRFTAGDVASLETVVSALDDVERNWPCLESACSGAPPTLVHCDFRPKNAKVKSDGVRTELYPFDWETAGWGLPAPDLTQIDLAAYWSVVGEAWPDVQLDDVRRWAEVGCVFQLLAACDWESVRLACEYPPGLNRPLSSFEKLHGQLVNAVLKVSGLDERHRRPGRARTSTPTYDQGATRLMTQTLEEGLSRLWGRSVQIREMRREPLSSSSSFRTERLRVAFEQGKPLTVFFKDLNPENQLEKARTVREPGLEPSHRELRMYQSILSPERFGTLHLYAFRWEPEQGRYWAFLEDGGRTSLHNYLDMPRWTAAARWAARFHAATRDLPEDQTSFLPRYDQAHYRRCAARVQSILPSLEPKERELVSRGLESYAARIDWLSALPRCVIHGQLFGTNILLRRGAAAPRILVIDWETAALGPGLFDLVSLSSGKWTREQRHTMWAAYCDAYTMETREPMDWERFCRDVAGVALYQALEWLAWWGRHRSLSRDFARFMRELGWVLDEHFRPDVTPGYCREQACEIGAKKGSGRGTA